MIPLNVLLAHALLDLTRAVERVDPSINVVQWSNLVRLVGDGGAPRRTMHLDARVSKRAMKTMIGAAARDGLVVDDGGIIRLTDTGGVLRRAWGDAVAEAERSWPHGDVLRAPLAAVVAGLELELPHYPVGYGTADVSITGGPGVDWKPVRRTEPLPSDGPVLALLSQAWVAFAIDYEWKRLGCLDWAFHLASSFDDGTVPLSEAPPPLAITGTGKSALERHGMVTVVDAVAHLTPIGAAIRDAYPSLVVEIESEWRDRHGAAAVDALRAALESVDASLTTRHADHPVVRHRPATGFRETSGT